MIQELRDPVRTRWISKMPDFELSTYTFKVGEKDGRPEAILFPPKGYRLVRYDLLTGNYYFEVQG